MKIIDYNRQRKKIRKFPVSSLIKIIPVTGAVSLAAQKILPFHFIKKFCKNYVYPNVLINLFPNIAPIFPPITKSGEKNITGQSRIKA
jgi:hypothetical protein